MKLSFVVAVGALAALAVALGLPEDVRAGVHARRSGDIIITHATPVQGDGLLVAVDSTHRDLASQGSASLPASMRETEVAALVSHVLGALPMASEVPPQVGAFPSSTLLRKPKGNLLLAIPELGHFTLDEFKMTEIQALREAHESFAMSATFEPRVPLAQLTTVLTGELPSRHGIVGGQWPGPNSRSVAAYDKQGSHSLVPNLADVVSHSFEGAAVLSFSGDARFAAAAAPHAGPHSKRASVLSVDAESRVVKDSRPSSAVPELALNEESFRLAIERPGSVFARFVQNGGSIRVDNGKVLLALERGSDPVVFDLGRQVDFLFLSELLGLDHVVANVREGSVKAENAPVSMTVTLVGFSRVVAEYGNSDAKTVAAARLLDTAVRQVVDDVSALFSGSLATEIVLLGSPAAVSMGRVQADIAEAVGSQLRSKMDVESTYPHIYVEEKLSDDDARALCSRVHNSVAKHGLKAECVREFARPILLQEKAAAKQEDKPTSNEIIAFQINLWVSILLILILLGGLYPLCCADFTGGVFSSYLFAKKYV